MAEILDLDAIIPDRRIVKLAGKEIDVSQIPSRVTLEIAKNTGKLKSGSDESFALLLDFVIKTCKPSYPEITEEWIVDNTSMEQLTALMEFILKPMQDKAAGNGKNLESLSK